MILSFILQATTLPEIPTNTLGDLEIEQLRSVIYGLLRQNSFTFLEVLEEGSIAAIKSTFRDVAKQVLAPEEQDATLTNIVADLAKKAKSKEWLSFFDLLLGSLISLLRRIHSIHNVIMEAIETANEASNTATDPISIPEQQLAAIKVSPTALYFHFWHCFLSTIIDGATFAFSLYKILNFLFIKQRVPNFDFSVQKRNFEIAFYHFFFMFTQFI